MQLGTYWCYQAHTDLDLVVDLHVLRIHQIYDTRLNLARININ